MADMRYCPQCKRMVNSQGSGSKKASVAFGVLGWGISRALNRECPICGTKLEYKTEQEYNNLGKEVVVPKKLSYRCSNCQYYLGSECPRQLASDTDIWRQKNTCDLYKLKNNPDEDIAMLKLRFAKGEITLAQYVELRKTYF